MKVWGMSKRRSLERWKEMADLGAEVALDDGWHPVRTQEHAKLFFQEILGHYDARNIVSRPEDHRWLLWALAGYYDLDKICPAGPSYFTVHANKDIGHTGNDKGFSVVGNGAEVAVPFAYMRALRGVPKTADERLALALQRGVKHQLECWLDSALPPSACCPVTGVALTRGVNVYVEYEHTFDGLKQTFLQEQKLDAAQVAVEEHDLGDRFDWRLADSQLLELWRQYHWQHMRLCVVSIVGHHVLQKQRLEQERAKELVRGVLLGLRTASVEESA
jgi:hypothetical protein